MAYEVQALVSNYQTNSTTNTVSLASPATAGSMLVLGCVMNTYASSTTTTNPSSTLIRWRADSGWGGGYSWQQRFRVATGGEQAFTLGVSPYTMPTGSNSWFWVLELDGAYAISSLAPGSQGSNTSAFNGFIYSGTTVFPTSQLPSDVRVGFAFQAGSANYPTGRTLGTSTWPPNILQGQGQASDLSFFVATHEAQYNSQNYNMARNTSNSTPNYGFLGSAFQGPQGGGQEILTLRSQGY